MIRILRLTRNQLYLATNQVFFWIAFALSGGYSVLSFVLTCIKYFGTDIGAPLSGSELFSFNDRVGSLWDLFVMTVPFVCVLAFGMQISENRQCRVESCFSSRVTKKEYYISGALCSVVSTFFLILLPELFQLFLLKITFVETGNTLMQAKYSGAFWKNIYRDGETVYHFQELYLKHPYLYDLCYALLFAASCAVLAFFFFALSAWVWKNRLGMLLAAAITAFTIRKVYDHLGYNLYGAIAAYSSIKQSFFPAIVLGAVLVVSGIVLLAVKAAGSDEDA